MPVRRSLAVLLFAVFASVAFAAMSGGSPAASTTHKWKFDPTINAPWAHEDDEGRTDSPTAAAGLCRSSPCNTSAPTVRSARTSTPSSAIRSNNSGFSNLGCTTPQNETTIAVNPTNPNNLIAGANDYRVCCDFTGLNDGTGWAYYSFDGGATWGNVQLPGLTAETGAKGQLKKMDSAGDPVMAFGPDGSAYYANIAFSRVSPASAIVVSVSHDGGRTWSDAQRGHLHRRRQLLQRQGVDRSRAQRQGRRHLDAIQPRPARCGLSSSRRSSARFSKDYGKTWNRQGFPISDAAHPFDQGSQVQYGPDGALYVAYEGSSPLDRLRDRRHGARPLDR